MSRSSLLPGIRNKLRRAGTVASSYLGPLFSDFGKRVPPSRAIAAALLVIAIAAGARLLYVDDLLKMPEEGNPMVPTGGPYVREVERLVAEGFVPDDPNPRSNAMRLLHPPGYLLYLFALFKVIGWDNRPGVMVVQAVLDSFTAVLFLFFTSWIANLRAGLAAALLIAISPHLAQMSVFVSPESLFALPVALAVCCLYLAGSGTNRLGYYLLGGFFLGLGCWLRSNGLLMSPFLALLVVAMARERKQALKRGLAMVLITAATIAPITIRNYLISGRFIPLSIGLGAIMMTAVGDYDFEKKYDLPKTDPEIAEREAEWYNRPDYAKHFLRPDGIERDRARVWRTLDVIKRHPGFYLSTVARRVDFMLRYDLPPGPDDWPFNTATPVYVSKYAMYGHGAPEGLQGQEVLSMDAKQLVEYGREAHTSLAEASPDVGAAQAVLSASSTDTPRLLRIPSIAVHKRTDYVLSIDATVHQGSMVAIVTGDRERRELASQEIGSVNQPSEEIRVPFASQDSGSVSVTLFRNQTLQEPISVGVRSLRMSEIGSTPAGWTDYIRWAFRGLQRNLYSTLLMRVLWVAGMAVLLLLGYWREALWIAAVPLYYLAFQSLLHTEYRYVLPMHYFLFALAGIGLYSVMRAAADGFGRVWQSVRSSSSQAFDRGADK